MSDSYGGVYGGIKRKNYAMAKRCELYMGFFGFLFFLSLIPILICVIIADEMMIWMADDLDD